MSMVVTILLKNSTKHLHFIFQHYKSLGEENNVALLLKNLRP